jgi:hypothetical protein
MKQSMEVIIWKCFVTDNFNMLDQFWINSSELKI